MYKNIASCCMPETNIVCQYNLIKKEKKVFQAEGTASANVQRWDHTWFLLDHKEELATGRVGRAMVSGAMGSRLWTQTDEPCHLISMFTDPSACLV